MASRPWGSILTIELGGETRTYMRIASTKEAAYCLLDRWPGARGNDYREAILACTRVLKGEADDSLAIDSFLKAASSSHLPTSRAPIDEFELEIERTFREALLDDLEHASQKWASVSG